jgi:hypothetical protein
MTTRVLEPADWHLLDDVVPVGALLPGSKPIVVEREGVIVGCHVLMPVWHVECLWVHPLFRKTTVFGRLWAAVKDECVRMGITAVCTAALTDEVKALIVHGHGVPLPGEHFAVPVRM